MKHSLSRVLGPLGTMFIGAATVLGGALALSPPTPAGAASTGMTFTRMGGTDLYGTAQLIATTTFPTSSTAVLATSADPFDAAAGNYLAGVLKAPVLYTAPGSLPTATSDALSSMHVKSVLVLGGPLAISASVVTKLKGAGYTVTRISGTTVYQTAQAVADHFGAATVGITGSSSPTAVIAAGYEPGDLQATGPLAYAGPFPVLYSSTSGLPSATVDALKSLGIRQAIILGGSLAVPASVEATLTSLGITSQRLTGANNDTTAAKVATYEVNQLGFANNHVSIARGNDFADAVAGGPRAGGSRTPMLLTTNQTSAGTATIDWLTNNCASLTSGTVFGGPLAVSDKVVQDMQAAGSCYTTGLSLSPASTYASAGSSLTISAKVSNNGAPVQGARVDFFAVTATTTEGSGSKGGSGGSGSGSGTGTGTGTGTGSGSGSGSGSGGKGAGGSGSSTKAAATSGTCTLSSAALPASTGSVACTIDATDPVTNATGIATYTFNWTSSSGKRPLEGTWPMIVYAFTGAIGDVYNATSSTQLQGKASVTWTNAATTLQFSPTPAVFKYGSEAIVTATLMSTSEEGTVSPVPAATQPIVWSVYRGTTCTKGSTTPPSGTPVASGSGVTNSSGALTIRYKYTVTTVPTTDTVDCLFAYYDVNGNKALDSGEPANTTTVTWSSATSAPTTLTLSPTNGSALAGTSQVVTAKVADQFGAGMSGVTVSWTIARTGTSGGGTGSGSGTGTTDANGQVAITVPSSTSTGAYLITVKAGTLTASTKAYWVKEATSGNYTAATVLGTLATSEKAGYIDVSSGGKYLRLHYDTNDVMMIGSTTVRASRFIEGLTPGAIIKVNPYDATPAGVSTFSMTGEKTGSGETGGGGSDGGSGGSGGSGS